MTAIKLATGHFVMQNMDDKENVRNKPQTEFVQQNETSVQPNCLEEQNVVEANVSSRRLTCMSRTGDKLSSSSMSNRLVSGRGSKKTGAKPSSVCMISFELDSTVSSPSPILCIICKCLNIQLQNCPSKGLRYAAAQTSAVGEDCCKALLHLHVLPEA